MTFQPKASRSQRPFVILVGYDPAIQGGVTEVTAMLLPHLPEVVFLASHKYYHPRWKALGFALRAYFHFAWLVYAYRPAVAHIIIASPGDLLRNAYYVLLSRLLRVRIIIQFHYDIVPAIGNLPPLLRSFVVFYLRRAHVLCFLCKTLREDFAAKVFNARSIVIPNPIASTYMEELPLPRNARNGQIVYLGRDDPAKGMRELREAASLLAETQNVKFHCYGVTTKDAVDGGVYLHPWITGEEKRQIIRRAILVTLPSYTEAFPTSCLEAAASGTPVVASNVGGIPDLIADGEQGLLVPPRDALSLAEAISTLIKDHELWDRCSRTQRARSLRYDLSQVIDKWHALYAGVCVKSPRFAQSNALDDAVSKSSSLK